LQEHASNNPGLQSFLDKKSDEHVYSALYLIAGAFCIYAAFCHGEDFCTSPPPAGLQVRGNRNLSPSLCCPRADAFRRISAPHARYLGGFRASGMQALGAFSSRRQNQGGRSRMMLKAWLYGEAAALMKDTLPL